MVYLFFASNANREKVCNVLTGIAREWDSQDDEERGEERVSAKEEMMGVIYCG